MSWAQRAVSGNPKPRESTVQQIADHMAEQVIKGRGQWPVRLDRRGVSFLDGHDPVNVVTPPVGEQVDPENQTLFLSLRF